MLNQPELQTNASRPRRKKGTVAIFEVDGWLKLRWSYAAKRYVMACGLQDDPINRRLAQQKAQGIKTDMRDGQFSRSLGRYRENPEPVVIAICDIFKRYSQFKARNLKKRSLEKYQVLQGHLEQFFEAKPIEQLNITQAFNFRDWLLKCLNPITVRERIAMLQSCWKWAKRQKQVEKIRGWMYRSKCRQNKNRAHLRLKRLAKLFPASENTSPNTLISPNFYLVLAVAQAK